MEFNQCDKFIPEQLEDIACVNQRENNVPHHVQVVDNANLVPFEVQETLG